MKELTKKSAFYCPPTVEVLAVTVEGVLCASQNEGYNPYNGNIDFDWED